MSDINRVVIAHWKLKKWLDSRNFNKIMIAESSLNQIDIFLKKQQIEIIDLTGSRYDLGLSVDVLSSDTDLSEFESKKFYIEEMTKPIIMQNGIVSAYGEVKLTTKDPMENSKKIHKQQTGAPEQTVMKDNFIKMNEGQTLGKIFQGYRTLFFSLIAIILLFSMFSIFYFSSLNTFYGLQVNKFDSILEELEDLENIVKRQEITLRKLESDNITLKSQIELLTKSDNGIFDQYGNELVMIYHKVQSGDTLIGLCRKYRIDYQSSKNLIKSLNGLSSNDDIYIGQIVILPKERIND